ncbi:MAG: hypothetical protein HC827_23135 [Cyanobacteria bacterium RM1_2_2]|nr:hypothetical protein [Cyanobacteria bacterium RM1_2_2]
MRDWENAALYYSQALELWQSWQGEITQLWHGETIREWQAKTAFALGQAYKNLGKSSEAITALDQAANLYQEGNDFGSAAYCLVEIGDLLFTQREWLKALEYFNQALPLWQDNHQASKADNYAVLAWIIHEGSR